MLGLRHFCFTLSLLFALTACQSTCKQGDAKLAQAALQPTAAEVKVMSYNIRHGEGTDGVFDLKRLADIIRSERPILVALQEVDSGTGRASGIEQDVQLAALTGMDSVVFGEAIPYMGGSYGDAVLSRWPIVDSDVFLLPAEPHHEKRVAVAVVVEVPQTGRRIRFVGTHLDHTSDPSDRIAQAQALNARLLPADMPTLLVGDLNAQPDSQPMKVLFDAGWQAADATHQPTFPSKDADLKIDWFLNQAGQGASLKDYQVLSEPIASDHCPIVATWVIEG
ncbi:MAG: endonuclease/exonuclease/phosphatase family protein [Planctomycetota bacterium]|jgi:endonuclease/exonuclease/phosphatase family metal-dependent hydrolase|nr:endonuclease/exonuclease/phosphatase family protein [Planctomycetota bacterium]